MNHILKATAVIATSLLMQACAPANNNSAANEGWWRVTPVDISDEANQVGGNANNGAVNSVSQGASQTAIDSTSIAVYRFTNLSTGAHRSTQNGTQAFPWRADGQLFSAFVTEYASRTGIYSCRTNGGDYFTSSNATCDGQTIIGRIGFVERTATAQAPRPLYRCAGNLGGHLDALDTAECTNNGYLVEGISGYVP